MIPMIFPLAKIFYNSEVHFIIRVIKEFVWIWISKYERIIRFKAAVLLPFVPLQKHGHVAFHMYF